MTSKTVSEIARQLKAQGVNLKGKMLVQIDDNTLRVHKPSRKIGDGTARSVDISYNKGSDLYDVAVHEIKGTKIKSSKVDMQYFDDLPKFF